MSLALTDDELLPEVINAFSLTINKTEHIDYFKKNNLSVEEIKLSQIYSAISAFSKVMTDLGFPKFFGKIGNIYRLIYNINERDKNIRISSLLKYSKEPVVICSSGVNDLMREIGANPFGIKKDYKYREIKPNYYYTLEKTSDPKTLENVMESIEKNYNSILSINDKTDIYTLGAYVPKSLQKNEMNIFRDLAISYNENLQDLCNQYGITFINTDEIGKEFIKSKNNFHISSTGHSMLANYILSYMYRNKIIENRHSTYQRNEIYEISNNGAKGVVEATLNDYNKCFYEAMDLIGYYRERMLFLADEHKRETEIFQKVLKSTSK